MEIQWEGVADPRGRIEGYIIEYRRYDEASFQEFEKIVRHSGAQKYSEKISGLIPDNSYIVRIKVVDKRQRVSDPSPTAEARTGCEGKEKQNDANPMQKNAK